MCTSHRNSRRKIGYEAILAGITALTYSPRELREGKVTLSKNIYTKDVSFNPAGLEKVFN
jgi:hypothetical protein